jgi:cytochrome c556
MKFATLLFCALAAALTTIPSAAHDHATGVVKERMEMMEDMAKRLKAIRERIDKNRDRAAIKTDAEAIAAQAPHITHLFPKGSVQRPTDAKAAIWQNWPDFERKAAALEDASRKLAAVGQDDLAALRARERAVSQACGACHELYRVRRR